MRCVQRIQSVILASVGSTIWDHVLGNKKSHRETVDKFGELAQKALAMDDSISGAHALLCWFYLLKREYNRIYG